MTAPIEDASGINDHTRRMHLASDDALGLNLHAALRKNHAVKAAGDDDAVAFDLSLDAGTFAEHHSLLRDDVALHLAVNAERPFELERALQPFGQAKPSTTRNYGGTGLGLPITKGLIEAHGGKLAIESRPGQGTIARISLPTERRLLMARA